MFLEQFFQDKRLHNFITILRKIEISDKKIFNRNQ